MPHSLKSLLLALAFSFMAITGYSQGITPQPGAITWTMSPVNGHWYGIDSVSRSWLEAEGIATGLGGHLATVRSQAEQDWIANSLYPTFLGSGSFWIGLNDLLQEGLFVWSSGEPVTYTAWDSSQPDNNGGTEDCVHIWSHLQKWNDTEEWDSATPLYEVEVLPPGTALFADDFNDGVLDTSLWGTITTAGGAAVTESGGVCNLINRGILYSLPTVEPTVNADVTVSCVFKNAFDPAVTKGNDNLQVWSRSDLSQAGCCDQLTTGINVAIPGPGHTNPSAVRLEARKNDVLLAKAEVMMNLPFGGDIGVTLVDSKGVITAHVWVVGNPLEDRILTLPNKPNWDLGNHVAFFNRQGAGYKAELDDVVVNAPSTPPVATVKVVMGDAGLPIQGAEIYAVDPSAPPLTSPQRVLLGVTDSDGVAQLWGKAPWNPTRIAAHVTVDDFIAGKNATKTIINYPSYSPLGEYDLQGSLPLGIPAIKFPWPVLLQSGLNGGLGTWWYMQPELEADPLLDPEKLAHSIPAYLCYPMPSENDSSTYAPLSGKGYDNDALSIKDHQNNADLLLHYATHDCWDSFSSLFANNGLSDMRYNLIGHSMGGPIVRAFALGSKEASLLGVSGSELANRVITLDGVHCGTVTALFWMNGLQQWAMNGISIVPLLAPPAFLAGWNEGYKMDAFDQRWLTYSASFSAIVLPKSSAYGVGESIFLSGLGPKVPSGWSEEWVKGYRLSRPLMHSSLFGSNNAINTNPGVTRECGLFLRDGTTPGDAIKAKAAGGQAPGRSAKSSAIGRFEFTQGSLSGSTTTQSVQFDQNSAVHVEVTVFGLGASYSVTGQGGAALPQSQFVQEDVAEGVVQFSFDLAAPPIGAVFVHLFAGPNEDAQLGGVFEFDNGRNLGVFGGAVSSGVGVPVAYSAQVQNSAGVVLVGSQSVMTAQVEQPDGTSVAMQLADDGLSGDGLAGDGVFGGSFTPTVIGRHSITVQGTLDLPGETVMRTGQAVLVAPSTNASLVGVPLEVTPDADGNGLFESLGFDQTVNVNQAGQYRLVGTLRDALGGTIADLSGTVTESFPGTVSVPLEVDASVLQLHGVAGPWTLDGLVLFDVDSGMLACDSAPAYATAAYSLSAFESPDSPLISLVIPAFGPASGGNTIELNGASLAGVTKVMVGKFEANILSSSEHSVVVMLPVFPSKGPGPMGGTQGSVGALGTVDVSVSTPWGTDLKVGAYRFGPQASQGGR